MSRVPEDIGTGPIESKEGKEENTVLLAALARGVRKGRKCGMREHTLKHMKVMHMVERVALAKWYGAVGIGKSRGREGLHE